MGKYMTIKHLFLLVQQLPPFCLFLSLGIEEFVYKPLSFNQICAMTLGTLTYHPFNYMLLKLTAPSRLYVCFCYWLVSHIDSCVFFNICKQSSKHSKGLKLCIIYLSEGRKIFILCAWNLKQDYKLKRFSMHNPEIKLPNHFFAIDFYTWFNS